MTKNNNNKRKQPRTRKTQIQNLFKPTGPSITFKVRE